MQRFNVIDFSGEVSAVGKSNHTPADLERGRKRL